MKSQHLPRIWKILYPFIHSCFAEKDGFVPQTGYLLASITMSYSHEQPHPIPNKVCARVSICMPSLCAVESHSFLFTCLALAIISIYLFYIVCLSNHSWKGYVDGHNME